MASVVLVVVLDVELVEVLVLFDFAVVVLVVVADFFDFANVVVVVELVVVVVAGTLTSGPGNDAMSAVIWALSSSR